MATQPHVETPQEHQGIEFPKAVGYCWHCNIPVDDHIVFCEERCKRLWLEERAGPTR